MASSKWKSWDELLEKVEGRRIVYWGATHWIERTLDNLQARIPGENSLQSAYIVDNNVNNQGNTFTHLPVKSPKQLISEDRDSLYVVITTASYPSVIDELLTLGFVMGDDFCCSPLLNERRSKDELKSVDRTVLLSSSTHHSDNTSGGGVYAVRTSDGSVSKMYSGKVRGMARVGKQTLVLDMLVGLVLLDEAFKVVQTIPLQSKTEPHGLCYDQDSNNVFIGQPGRDSIAVYSLGDGTLVREFFVSEKWSRNKMDNHHINDICVYDGSLFVSMFSFSGNWMHETYDGGILEIELESGKILGPVVSDLWMPHSVQRIDGKLTYIDSMHSELRSSRNTIGKFSGFLRGLDFDGRYYYVGTTEHRYPEKLRGLSLNISLDTGFYLFDAESKMSRFFPLASTDGIHSVLVA